MQYSRRDARVSERQEGNPVAPSAEGGKGIRIVAQMLGPVRFDVSASSAPLLPWQDGRGPHQGTTPSLLLVSTQKKGVQGSGLGLLNPRPICRVRTFRNLSLCSFLSSL